MESKKVLIICLDMDPLSIQGDQHTGAAHLYVKETLEALADSNIETIAITRLNDQAKPIVQQLSKSVKLVRIILGEPKIEPKEYFWGKEEITFQRIEQTLTENDFMPDLVHSIYWYSGKVGLRLADKFNVPHAYTIISLGKVKHQSLGKPLNSHDINREITEQEIFLNSKIIFSVCQQEKHNLLGLYPGIDENKIAVIGRGVDIDLFSPKKMVHGLFPEIYKPYLFFAGRLISSKGLPFLIKVYERLLEDQTILSKPQLIIAGGTPEEVKQSQCRGLTSATLEKAYEDGEICWLGRVPRNQMPILYSNALLTCLPSIYDPAARVILESMACGTPLIMTETGYSEEVVFSSINGFIATYGDENVWLNCIASVIKNRSWHKKLAARARPSVLPYFSLREFKDRHMQAYKATWSAKSGRKIFIKPKLSEIEKIFPHWEVPDAKPMYSSREDILIWCQSLGIEGDLTELSVNQIASSRIFSLKTSANEFIIKQPKPKLLFYKMFYPTDPYHEVDFKPTQARWHAEQLFSKLPLFKEPIAVNESLSLIIAEKYTHTDILWNVQRIEKFFETVRQFQKNQTVRFKDVLDTWSLTQDHSLDWQFFNAYDRKLNQLNAHFRNSAIWFTPAHAEVELNRFKLIFASDHFPVSEDMLQLLIDQNHVIFELLADLGSNAGIVWGECRPGHVVKMDGRLYGIDAETCCFGQPEIDYANFLWWFIGLRGGRPNQSNLAVVSGVLKLMSYKNRAYTLAWIWLINLYWLWWDTARGRRGRKSNFISFFYEFKRMLREIY